MHTSDGKERASMRNLALELASVGEADRTAHAEAEAAQHHLAFLAETRERNRLAQELHNNVAQAVGYLNLQISVTNDLLAEGQMDQVAVKLQELKKLVGEVYTDVREEIFNLRSQGFSELSFLELLFRYIDKYKRFYNLDIQLVMEMDEAEVEFPVEVRSSVVRTIQEALINVRKHAQVDQAIIRFSRENEQLCIKIEDQGWGFDPVQIYGKQGTANFGLQIMHERMASIGGNLEIKSRLGQGTQIILRYAGDKKRGG